MSPVLSIAIITYNQEKYIKQTLDSILTQKHNFSYEIIIGEDCSTDNTRNIIKEYEEKYSDIIKPIYNNTNMGLIKNYFNVISECKGKYIMECAGDDYWLPGKIQTQISFMEKHPDVSMCYGKALVYNQQKNKLTKDTIGKKSESFAALLECNNIPALTVCLKNTTFQKYISEVHPEKKNWLMEDYPSWLWISKNGKIKFLQKKLCVYRLVENSLSHFNDSEKLKKFEKSTIDIKNFFCVSDEEKKLLENYMNLQKFNSFWDNRDRENFLLMAKKIKSDSFTLKMRVKVFLSKRKFIYEKIF